MSNKHQHSTASARLFGGNAEQYYNVHDLIDRNKLVTGSIFSRFFLHSADVGLYVLKKVVGESIGDVPVEKPLKQHLVEDYGRIVTFQHDWAPALLLNKSRLPKLRKWEHFLEKRMVDPRIQDLSEQQLQEIENLFLLVDLPQLGNLKKRIRFAIFGHYTGINVLAEIMGPKFYEHWTMDVLTGYISCRFVNSEEGTNAPTLLDWEQAVPDLPWMHAPETNPSDIVILTMVTGTVVQEKAMSVPGRRPCNMD